jgi:elongation factor P
MIEATGLKNGTTFLSDKKPYKVLKYSLIKQGRGGAIVHVLARNLISGAIEEKTFSSNNKVEDIATSKRVLQYLYSDDKNAFFMDLGSYDQVDIPLALVGEEISYVKEGQTVTVLFWEDRALGVEIPPKVVLKVVDAPPGVKGNSASNIYKQAKLENGVVTKVPLFINNGDRIVVDTRTNEYVERAKTEK